LTDCSSSFVLEHAKAAAIASMYSKTIKFSRQLENLAMKLATYCQTISGDSTFFARMFQNPFRDINQEYLRLEGYEKLSHPTATKSDVLEQKELLNV
jgi:hypothetical protein